MSGLTLADPAFVANTGGAFFVCTAFEVGDVTNMFVGNVTLNNAGDIAALTGFDGISGNVTVGGGLTSLVGLEDLRYVGGDFNIISSLLVNLDGIDNLTTVNGNFTIQSNSSLIDVDALTSLYRVTDLQILNHTSLVDASGMCPCLTTVGDDLVISGNSALTSMEGAFPSLTTGGYIDISSNSSLVMLPTFPLLTSLSGNLYLAYNTSTSGNVAMFPTLLSVNNGISLIGSPGSDIPYFPALTTAYTVNIFSASGSFTLGASHFPNLSNVSNQISIDSNIGLSSIAGCFQVLDVCSVEILNNTSLTSMTGAFPALVDIDSLLIQNNTALIAIEDAFGPLNGSLASGPVVISGNTTLPTQTEVYDFISDLYCSGYTGTNTTTLNGFDPAVVACGSVVLAGDVTNMFVGNVSIVNAASITALAGYDGISGNLIIEATALTNLSGLEGIKYVGGIVVIASNASLTSVAGLSGLRTIGRSSGGSDFAGLTISGNSVLTDISPLYGINLVGSLSLEIEGVTSLAAAFPCIVNCGYIFILMDNNCATMAGAFPELQRANNVRLRTVSSGGPTPASFDMTGAFPVLIRTGTPLGGTHGVHLDIFAFNTTSGTVGSLFPALTTTSNLNLQAKVASGADLFPALTDVCGDPNSKIIVNACGLLTDLSGFGSVVSIRSGLDIINNPDLTDVSALLGVDGAKIVSGATHVTISNNSNLPTAAQAQALIDNYVGEGYGGSTTNSGNGPG